MDIKETPEQVIARVASGFRAHFTMNRLEDGVATKATVELAQIAMQIHEAVVPKDITARNQDRAYEYRSFLEQCGFDPLFAHEFISDDEPDGIY